MTRAAMTTDDLADLFDAFNRHDIAGVMRHFAEDCVFDAVAGPEAYGARHEGRAAVAQAFEAVWKAMPDAHWAHRDHLVQGDRAVSEWTFTGTERRRQPHRGRGRRSLPAARRAHRPQAGPAQAAPAAGRLSGGGSQEHPFGNKVMLKHFNPTMPYDPRYDPVTDAGPGHNRDYCPTYWIGTAGSAAGGRRAGGGGHGRGRGDRRLGLHRPLHRDPPRPRARHQGDGARGQPRRLGLQHPQRRPGAESRRGG